MICIGLLFICIKRQNRITHMVHCNCIKKFKINLIIYITHIILFAYISKIFQNILVFFFFERGAYIFRIWENLFVVQKLFNRNS